MPLSNSEYEYLLRTYDEKRTRADRILAQRREEVYSALPQVRALDDALASDALRRARNKVLGKPEDGTDPNAAVAEYSAQRASLLTQGGYPADYLEPPYECPLCGDTGFCDGRKCSCFLQAQAALLSERDHLGAVLSEENFDTFSLSFYPETMKDEASGMTARELAARAFSAARRAAAQLPQGACNVYIYGKAGLGKTFLTHCIAKEARDLGLGTLYFSAPSLVELLGDISFTRTEEASFERQVLQTADLLIIDDLGAELTNTFVAASLFRIVNERLLSRRSTVISSNLSLPQLRETYSDRLYSRIASGYTVIRLIGEDIRIRKMLSVQ